MYTNFLPGTEKGDSEFKKQIHESTLAETLTNFLTEGKTMKIMHF